MAALDAGTTLQRACEVFLVEVAPGRQGDDITLLVLQVDGHGTPDRSS